MNIRAYIGDRKFYKGLLAVMLPILVQNGITNFINLLDNIMVGQVGTEQMSGVSIVNQLLMVFYLCVFGAVSAAGLFGAQFFGRGDHKGMGETFRFKLYIAGAMYIVAMLVFALFGEPLAGLYLHEGGETGDLALTMHYAKEYLAISLWGLFPYTLTQVYAGSLREAKKTVPPMAAGIIGVAVNLLLNYLLIFGKLGLPVMGVRGAAVATVISRFVECAIVMIWAHLHTGELPFLKGVYRSFRISPSLGRRILTTGIPLVLNEALWSAGMAALLQCYSFRGLAVVSAMNISNIISNTFAILYLSMGTTISILLGHRLGAGETEKAKTEATQMIAFSICMGLLAGGFIALFANAFPHIYNTTNEVRALATDITYVVALAAPLHAIINAAYFTLRSGGKTLITFLFDAVYVWCVSVLLAFVLSRFTAIPVVTVYFIVQMVDIFKCALGLLLVKSGVWVKDITQNKTEISEV